MTPAIRHATVATLLASATVSPSAAQLNKADRIELHAGGGYADLRASNEQAPPSGGTIDIGGAVWWSEHWGLAARTLRIAAVDRYNLVYDASWRTHVDNKNARYAVVTVRHRRFTPDGIELSVGVGLFAGSYERTDLIRGPGRGEREVIESVPGGGFAGELLVGYKLLRHVGVKAGLAAGGPWEAVFAHPFAVVVVSF